MGSRWRGWGHTDRLVAIGAAFLVLYGSVLAWNGPADADEAFPFFNWSLFSEMPDPIATDYSIRFTRVDGEDLAEPVYFEDAAEFVNTTGSPEAYQTIQRLGSALAGDRILQVAENQDRLELAFLAGLSQADYEVVRRRFDILERRECDCFISETVVAEGSVP
jgi:hypothetical protein